MPEKINLSEKFSKFSEHWTPKILGQLNGLEVKVAKFQGEFVWHQHDNTDELFFVVEGCFTMRFRDKEVVVNAGEMIIVPRGVEHMPVAEQEVHVVLIEDQGTVNTGDSTAGEKTATDLEQI